MRRLRWKKSIIYISLSLFKVSDCVVDFFEVSFEFLRKQRGKRRKEEREKRKRQG